MTSKHEHRLKRLESKLGTRGHVEISNDDYVRMVRKWYGILARATGAAGGDYQVISDFLRAELELIDAAFLANDDPVYTVYHCCTIWNAAMYWIAKAVDEQDEAKLAEKLQDLGKHSFRQASELDCIYGRMGEPANTVGDQINGEREQVTERG